MAFPICGGNYANLKPDLYSVSIKKVSPREEGSVRLLTEEGSVTKGISPSKTAKKFLFSSQTIQNIINMAEVWKSAYDPQNSLNQISLFTLES